MLCAKFVEKVGFEPRTLGTKAEHFDHCATRLVELRHNKLMEIAPSSSAQTDGASSLTTNLET